MITNSFLSKSPKSKHEIRSQSKEQFFSIKKNAKRLKISNIFSQTSEKLAEPMSKTHQSEEKSEDLFANIKFQRQELASTICSDHYLTFRSKQPKRKKNKQPKISNNQSNDEESASQNETPFSPVVGTTANKPLPISQSQSKVPSRFSAADFVFLSKIGQGTYSSVFKVMQKATGLICSMKMLNKQKMRSLKVEQNIFREIKIQSFVNHPHIIKLYGCFHDEKSIYLICEYATDDNVHEYLSKHKLERRVGLEVEKVSMFVGQISCAINYMHTNFIIHRDVKPENMIITYGDTIKICDFGWSVYNPDKEMRSTLCGTPLYLAPELINSDNYNESVDVWALGVLTYELLTNEIPFKIKSMKDLKKVASTEIKYEKIKCIQAVDFIQNALKKDLEERLSIQELFHHPFLKYFHQQQNM